MVDIHCHILHGIDDGAEAYEVALNMARLAVANGTTSVIASPHANIPGMPFENTVSIVEDCVNALNSAFKNEGIPLTLYPGCEVFASGNFTELLRAGKLPTLNHSDYVLVEFDFYEHPVSVFTKLEELCNEGFIPIVAHPERYAFIEDEPSSAEILKNMGCLIQCNKGSLAGRFGTAAKFASHDMLVRGQVDFIASDAHGADMRTPVLSDAYRTVSDLYGSDYAELLFKINPQKVIENKKI